MCTLVISDIERVTAAVIGLNVVTFALRRRSLFVRYIAISECKVASEFDPRAVPPEIKFRASVTYYYYTDLLKHTFSFSVQIR